MHSMNQVVTSKLFALIFLMIQALYSFAEETQRIVDEDHFLISLDANFNSGLYTGLESFVYPDIYLDARYGRLYAQDQTIGYDLTWSERASLSLAITRNKDFFDVAEAESLQPDLYIGIQDKERAIEAGLVYKYESRVGLVSFEYFKDITNKHDSHRGVVRLARSIPVKGGFSLVPSIYVNYYSAKYNLYYYGVTREENNRGIIQRFSGPGAGQVNTVDEIDEQVRETFENDLGRQEYDPGNSGHFGIDINIFVPISENLGITGYFAYEDITGPVFRSPFVEDRKLYRGRLGVAYSF